MPGDHCLVCASDEGIFLDILDQPALWIKAKNCRLDKLSEDGPSTKICHKCAFEIEQCNIFVDKIRKANKIQNFKKGCCILCLNAYNKEIFFDLSNQKFGVNNLIQRIHNLFPDELKCKEVQRHLICLSCRYCVDLLSDLRILADEIPAKLETIIRNCIDPSDLPKTRTSIVNRKTTFIQSSNLDLNTPSDTDSDSSSIMNNRKRKNKVNKTVAAKSQRKCEQCKAEVRSGADMYKIYRTGVTVCKQCWLTIDPDKTRTLSKKRKKNDYTETKLCSVLLEDVYKKKYEKEYKIEKDSKGNTVFIVTDDSESENRTKCRINKTISNDIEIKESLQNIEFRKTKFAKGGKRREEIEKNTQEIIEIKSTRSSNKRKEPEQNLRGEIEFKCIKSRRFKELEEILQEEIDLKPTKLSSRRKDSEDSVEENVEIKNLRMTRRRKESEESSYDTEFRCTRLTTNRKDSDHSAQEISEVRPIRLIRQRYEYENKPLKNNKNVKDSFKSLQEIQIKSPKNNRNRRDSERSSQESTEIISTREHRRWKESEQSAQEDVEVNVDIDSDSAPILKKVKKSNLKVESMPKQIQSSINNQNNVSNVIFTRKRARSSSIESADSIRKSTRTMKKNSQELDEIIEIDDDSNLLKIKNDNTVDFKTNQTNQEKRASSHDNHSDIELNALERKFNSKQSDLVLSKESIPILQFKAPHIKSNTDNLASLKLISKEVKLNKFGNIQKFHIEKGNDAESLKSIEIDTSESEEIDVLKSTDEEAKDDTLETETEEKYLLQSPVMEENIFKSASIDHLKLDKKITESVNTPTLIDEGNSNSIKKTIHIINNLNNKTINEVNKSNSVLVSVSDFEHRRNHRFIKQDVEYEKKNLSLKSQNEFIEENVIVTSSNKKDDIVQDILNDMDKEIIVTDINDTEININVDYSASEPLQENIILSKQSILNKSRKYKYSNKKSRKYKNKDSVEDIVVSDSSDSELIKITEPVYVNYTCTICDKIYENKFIGLQHELTHMKTLEIKLEKIELPETNKCFNELDIELQKSSTKNTFYLTEELMTADQNKEESVNKTKSKKQESEKENQTNKMGTDKKGPTINIQTIKESTLQNNINTDSIQINEDKALCNKLSEIQDHFEENRQEREKVKVNDFAEEKAQIIANKEENEVETNGRRSMKILSKNIEVKFDRKLKARKKTINENIKIDRETATIVGSDSDKIAEAVQETLNDMAELHVKIQELNPVNVLASSESITFPKLAMENNEIKQLRIENENIDEIQISQSNEQKESIDTMRLNGSKSEEKNTCETANVKSGINNAFNLDLENQSSLEKAHIVGEVLKQKKDASNEMVEEKDDKNVLINSLTNTNNKMGNVIDGVQYKLSKSDQIIEVEVLDSNENIHDNQCILNSSLEVNIEPITERKIVKLNKSGIKNNDVNLKRSSNDSAKKTNVEDDNNTEDEEALAQESLEELMQRGGLQIIDELAESVTDGEEECEKEVNISSEKEKEVEIDNLQIKISDGECTEILEISKKSLSKQKESDKDALCENQIIKDVNVVEEVINNDERPNGNVIQEVDFESNGNCVNIPNNVIGQVLTNVFSMATVDISKRLDLQTEPISDEETEIIPETVENISREIRNSQDMPSLDPIGEVNDD